VTQMHRNAFHVPQILPEAKAQVWWNISNMLFMQIALGPPRHEKSCNYISCPGRSEMHYVTRRSHRLQKHKFNVTSPGTLSMETALGRPEHEKKCIDNSRPRCTGMHYVNHRSYQMEKHKFGVTCSSALFMETAQGQMEHEK
jgi:hypothetical protein